MDINTNPQNQNQMNQPMQQPMMQPQQKKGGKGWLVAIIVIIIALLALMLLGKAPEATDDTMSPETANQQSSDDLSSIEAELEATQFEGVSEGL